MITKRMFEVTLTHPGTTTPVTLPVLRDESEVSQLRAAYNNVIARAVENTGAPIEQPAMPGFRQALTALVDCYKKAEAEGNTALASRAQNAVAALLGHQPHLKNDDDEPFGNGSVRQRITLVGIPGGGR